MWVVVTWFKRITRWTQPAQSFSRFGNGVFCVITGIAKSFKTKLPSRHGNRKPFQLFSRIFYVNSSTDNSRLYSNYDDSEGEVEVWEMSKRVRCSIFMLFVARDTFDLCPVVTGLNIVNRLSPLDWHHSDLCNSKTVEQVDPLATCSEDISSKHCY